MVYEEFKTILSSYLELIFEDQASRSMLDKLFRELEYGSRAKLGFPKLDNNYVVFSNKVVHLETKKVMYFTPSIFTTHKLT